MRFSFIRAIDPPSRLSDRCTNSTDCWVEWGKASRSSFAFNTAEASCFPSSASRNLPSSSANVSLTWLGGGVGVAGHAEGAG